MSVYPPSDVARAAEASRPSSNLAAPRARVVAVVPFSPADDAGFEAGCFVTTVDGHPVCDLIDWRWLASEDTIVVGYCDTAGDSGEVELEREPGEAWGLEFEGVVFDGVKQCRNSCIFCFMRQLPDDMRSSLTLRDDDFRLSFLAGTFVTFTNLSPQDETRIIKQHISPLRVSLHAFDAQVRRRIIGKHAVHGIEVLKRLLEAGIEFHAQIVLMPGINDGEVLINTLKWAYGRPGIKDVCIVPLGFTKHQKQFKRSFNDPASARAVMNAIVPFQKRALKERGSLWAFAADEFYHNAYGSEVLENLPPAEHYGDFGMFEDGVGIIRSFVDDWEKAEQKGLLEQTARALEDAHTKGYFIMGYAMKNVIGPLIQRSALNEILTPLFVKNDFFGGNVDVTGLLCGVDIIKALKHLCCHQAEKHVEHQASSSDTLDAHQASSARAGQSRGHERSEGSEHVAVFIPSVLFNDRGITLDDMSLKDMEKAVDVHLSMVSCNPYDFLREIANLVGQTSPTFNRIN